MAGKRKNWHRDWLRLQNGRLRHVSGAEIIVGDGCATTIAAPETIGRCHAHELARGVPLHNLAARVQRLIREGAEWHQRNQ